MKRPGDEQPPTAQRAAKLQKSVTFSLEPSHKHPRQRQRQVSSSVSSSNTSTNNRPSSTMTGTTQPQSQTQSQGSSNSTMERRSILRSASSSLSGTSPRFTFDFVDDASLGTLSASRRSTYSSPNNRNQQNQRSRGNNKLSPSRLDARYSSRLPPSYHGQSPNNASHQHHYQRSYSSSAAGEEIKRNLFGGSEAIAMDEGSDSMMDDTSAGSGFNSGPNTPSSAQRGQRSSAPSSYSRTPSSSGTSPRYGHSYGYSYRQSPSPSNRSNNNNLSVATSSAISSRSSGTTPSTFMSNSPRKRGGVTGVTSPLSGNLGHASVASSAASSPANSCYNGGHNNGGNIMMVDYEARGAGDRFIPSRALSNLNFELKTGTGGARHSGGNSAHGNGTAGGNNHGNDNGNRAGNRGDTNGNGGASDAGGNNIAGADHLNPAPSFGATMMGGAPPVDDPAAAPGANATGAGPDGGQPGIASTFSDDAASNDGTSDHRHDATNRQPLLYDALLRSEMLGENVDPAMHSVQSPTGLINSGSSSMNSSSGNGNGMGMGGGLGNGGNHPNNVVTPFRERSNNLRFSPCNGHGQFYSNGGGMNHRRNERASIVNSFRLSPVSMSPNQRTNLGSYTERCKRKIAKVPTKVLDAPALQDDYYLNLVDWSSQNVLAVGLGSCVYLWSAATSRVTQLCDLSSTEDAVTSVAWSEGGRHLAIGSTRGDVQLWDASAQKLIRTMHGHSARVGALSWKLSGAGGSAGSSSLLASGSRDRLIHLRDPRSDQPYEMRLCGHKQEVCGLRWSFDERSMLASGGNDNKLLVWDVKKHTQPYHTFSDHTAAVKAIAWSPHQHGLLASGGGTADRCIRFWNCLTGHGINCIDTGSQVCNLAFSKNCNELVSTHGYSLNQIVVWKYPSMQKIATLTGHTYRVLYLALSPDGSTIVTGAGDETLRFWQVFPGPQKENKAGGLLFPAGMAGSVIR